MDHQAGRVCKMKDVDKVGQSRVHDAVELQLRAWTSSFASLSKQIWSSKQI